jgi:hypothetical protein
VSTHATASVTTPTLRFQPRKNSRIGSLDSGEMVEQNQRVIVSHIWTRQPCLTEPNSADDSKQATNSHFRSSGVTRTFVESQIHPVNHAGSRINKGSKRGSETIGQWSGNNCCEHRPETNPETDPRD